MTIQAWCLLMKLRKAQIYEDYGFGVDFDTMKATTISLTETKRKTVELSNYSASIKSLLDYLIECGYIECNQFGNGAVLHKGWHLSQTLIWNALDFLFRSVAVPIFVAFVTAIITIWLSKLP